MSSTLLTDLFSYGGIGLVAPDGREGAVSSEAYQVLYFFKLARPRDTAPWPSILSRVNQHLSAHGKPALSSQAARAVYDQLRKPGRWHFGSGDNVDHLARTHWQMDDTLRIHRAWHIVPVKFALDLVDEAGRPIGDTCHVLLVLDDDSELPIGIWPSAKPPSEAELGLATYQAIWHPGFSRWQLRGVPGSLYVPASLAGGGLTDLRRAADLMLVPVEVYSDERVWSRKPLPSKLREHGAETARGTSARSGVTPRRVYERLMRWLRRECFPNHRPDLLAGGVTGAGVGMPAWGWAGAGWLLPAEPASTVRDGVGDGGLVYTSASFRTAPGHAVSIRRFPYRYSEAEPGVFAERDGELHYLEASGERIVP
jgi:hypothetical protein